MGNAVDCDRAIKTVTVIFAVLSLQIACSNPAWHTTYQDDDVGYLIGLPVGWSPVPADIVAGFELGAEGTMREDPFFTPSEAEIVSANLTTVAIFSPHNWTSAQPRIPMLAVAIESGRQSESTPEYLALVGDHLSTSFERVSEVGKFRCRGKQFGIIQLETRVDQTSIYAHLYCIRHRDYMLSFHSIAFQPEELDLMRSMVCSTRLF